jgi:glutamate-1-semialdehyde 2,1-aminomutase
MDWRFASLAGYVLDAVALAIVLAKLKSRIELLRAKHPSLTGHARLARRFAALVPAYNYDEARFFCADDVPANIAAARQKGFFRLSQLFREHFRRSLRLTAQARESLPDLQFTLTYRVPFQFSRFVNQHLPTGAFIETSSGVMLTDLDGNHFYDLAGSYGVNVLGTDFYKACLEESRKRVAELGPVLGTYHPLVAANVKRLCALSGLDAVSFHMSGTEAVMQAVRLARYHTRRSHLVRFCGAYHGWWGDVQPGVGNPVPARETYTLADMSERSLRVLRHRHDIACMVVNPLQALHPNANAPGDSALIDSARGAHFSRDFVHWRFSVAGRMNYAERGDPKMSEKAELTRHRSA